MWILGLKGSTLSLFAAITLTHVWHNSFENIRVDHAISASLVTDLILIQCDVCV